MDVREIRDPLDCLQRRSLRTRGHAPLDRDVSFITSATAGTYSGMLTTTLFRSHLVAGLPVGVFNAWQPRKDELAVFARSLEAKPSRPAKSIRLALPRPENEQCHWAYRRYSFTCFGELHHLDYAEGAGDDALRSTATFPPCRPDHAVRERRLRLRASAGWSERPADNFKTGLAREELAPLFSHPVRETGRLYFDGNEDNSTSPPNENVLFRQADTSYSRIESHLPLPSRRMV